MNSWYCARGEMENRIKEAQLDLFADRLSTETFRANQLRLWFASAAYVLMHALRRIGLAGTALARACANTIRLTLLKIGAVVTVSVRRVKLAMSQACPNQARVHRRLPRPERRGALKPPHEPDAFTLNHRTALAEERRGRIPDNPRRTPAVLASPPQLGAGHTGITRNDKSPAL